MIGRVAYAADDVAVSGPFQRPATTKFAKDYLTDAIGEHVPADITIKASAHDTRKVIIHPGRMLPATVLAKHKLELALRKSFAFMRITAVRALRKRVGIVTKAGDDPDDASAAEQEILDAIASEWERLADAAVDSLSDSAVAGSDSGIMQLDITDEGLISRFNDTARRYAERRAAEMVGMRRDADGNLVENPDAEWAISDTTRDKLRSVIADVFVGKHPTLAEIEQAIEDAGIFDDKRATMIARTETANAQVNGNLFAWRESGLVDSVDWQLSAEHDDQLGCNCADNAADGPYDVDEVPDFPDHPNCMCALVLDRLVGESDDANKSLRVELRKALVRAEVLDIHAEFRRKLDKLGWKQDGEDRVGHDTIVRAYTNPTKLGRRIEVTVYLKTGEALWTDTQNGSLLTDGFSAAGLVAHLTAHLGRRGMRKSSKNKRGA